MEFVLVDLAGERPQGVCDECGLVANHHEFTGTDIVYCWHRSIGCVRAPGREWVVVNGIPREGFIREVVRSLTMGELFVDIVQQLSLLQQADDGTKQ